MNERERQLHVGPGPCGQSPPPPANGSAPRAAAPTWGARSCLSIGQLLPGQRAGCQSREAELRTRGRCRGLTLAGPRHKRGPRGVRGRAAPAAPRGIPGHGKAPPSSAARTPSSCTGALSAKRSREVAPEPLLPPPREAAARLRGFLLVNRSRRVPFHVLPPPSFFCFGFYFFFLIKKINEPTPPTHPFLGCRSRLTGNSLHCDGGEQQHPSARHSSWERLLERPARFLSPRKWVRQPSVPCRHPTSLGMRRYSDRERDAHVPVPGALRQPPHPHQRCHRPLRAPRVSSWKAEVHATHLGFLVDFLVVLLLSGRSVVARHFLLLQVNPGLQ